MTFRHFCVCVMKSHHGYTKIPKTDPKIQPNACMYTQWKYATLDICGMWHLMAIVASAIMVRGEWAGLCTLWQIKVKWRPRQNCEWPCHYMHFLYVIKWQMIRFQALRKTKSFDKVCLKFQLPLCTKAHSPTLSTVADATVAQSVVCHCYPEWHNFPVYHHHICVVSSLQN